jgi:hypothetical protein
MAAGFPAREAPDRGPLEAFGVMIILTRRAAKR